MLRKRETFPLRQLKKARCVYEAARPGKWFLSIQEHDNPESVRLLGPFAGFHVADHVARLYAQEHALVYGS